MRIRQEVSVSIFDRMTKCSITWNYGISTLNSPNFTRKQEQKQNQSECTLICLDFISQTPNPKATTGRSDHHQMK